MPNTRHGWIRSTTTFYERTDEILMISFAAIQNLAGCSPGEIATDCQLSLKLCATDPRTTIKPWQPSVDDEPVN